MNEAERNQNHELWLAQVRLKLQQLLQSLAQSLQSHVEFDQQLLMLLTLEPPLMESVRQTALDLPPRTLQELRIRLISQVFNRSCRNPPSHEALEATATELVNMLNRADSLKRLRLNCTSDGTVSAILTACSRLESVTLAFCDLTTASLRAMFSITTLRKLEIYEFIFLDVETVDFFCRAMETTGSTLKSLSMYRISFPVSPEHEAQVATTLARCNTLVHFDYSAEYTPSQSFCRDYCVALSNNVSTKLEQLTMNLYHLHHDSQSVEDEVLLHLHGAQSTARGVEAVIIAKVRNLLKWNVQRKNCPPLFAAIGNAETDAERKQCVVKAFEAVDIPVVFEYVIANQNNMIALIQRLGRSRKRQREE